MPQNICTDSATFNNHLQTTKINQRLTEIKESSSDLRNHGETISCTMILDLFRLLPAEREFLLGEIFSATVTDLQSPSQAPGRDGEDNYIDNFSSKSLDIELSSLTTLSDNESEKGTSSHEALADQPPRDSSDQPETKALKEERIPYGPDSLILCDLWLAKIGC
jgi:hypothetical protein